MYLLGCQLCTIRVHWLLLRVNNDEVYDCVSSFSDQVDDISYEASGSSKAKGLLMGIRKVHCFLGDGIKKNGYPVRYRDHGLWWLKISYLSMAENRGASSMANLATSAVIVRRKSAQSVAIWQTNMSQPTAHTKAQWPFVPGLANLSLTNRHSHQLKLGLHRCRVLHKSRAVLLVFTGSGRVSRHDWATAVSCLAWWRQHLYIETPPQTTIFIT